ncbi:hypothetical protein [Nocardioides stalactiti]|uniref:hypothetical protein n=1 Tax=Nocardioides stalactiti TaxID=2755356 RepID=UPI001600E46D|nr:hypothetical protein [Nocardioides stalactiti]
MDRSRLLTALTALVALVASLVVAAPARAVEPIEDYPSYEPQRRCSPGDKPGTVEIGRWIVRRYGGGLGGIGRRCSRSSTSEHYEGRAFDWTVSARSRADRVRVRTFLRDLFASDRFGNTHARARRMGVMYVIWDDHMYAAWDGYRAEPYRSSGCRRIRTCSPTLRHRDHVHLSLTRPAARGETSWFRGR